MAIEKYTENQTEIEYIRSLASLLDTLDNFQEIEEE
jgi:hypothetical protein